MGKKEPRGGSAHAQGAREGGDDRRGLILMQEAGAWNASHYPQSDDSGSGGGMVTPKRSKPKKKFWEVGGGDDDEEVEELVQQHTNARDHEPGHHPDLDGADERGGSLWRAASNCMHDAQQSLKKVDEDSHVAEHMRQELCGRWNSQTLRASLLGSVVLFLLFLIYSLQRATAHGPPKKDPASTQGLISAKALCASDQDLFNPSSRMCKMENRIAFGAMALQEWAHCDLSSRGARSLQSNMDQSGSFWYSYTDRHEVRDFYRSCSTSCATKLDTFNPSTGLCHVSEPLPRAWLLGCHSLAAKGHQNCLVSAGQGAICEAMSSPDALTQVARDIFVPKPHDSRVPSLSQGLGKKQTQNQHGSSASGRGGKQRGEGTRRRGVKPSSQSEGTGQGGAEAAVEGGAHTGAYSGDTESLAHWRRAGGVGGGFGYRGASQISISRQGSGVGGGFGAGAGGRVKGLDGPESGWVGSGGGGVVFSTHLHTQEGAQEDYTYYFPEVGEKVKKFYTRCHALCAKGDTVLEATGAAAEAAAAAAFVGGTGSAGATCQVRYPHALGQLNNNGDLLHRCMGNVPRWIVAEKRSDGSKLWSYASAHRALVQVFYDSCA